MTIITRHEPCTDTSENSFATFTFTRYSRYCRALCNYFSHSHVSKYSQDTCTNHIYTTLYVALRDYIGDYSSDYMFTTFAVGRTFVSSSFENKLLLEPKVQLSLLILHPVATRSWYLEGVTALSRKRSLLELIFPKNLSQKFSR